MKKVIVIVGIMLMTGCVLVDYGNATIDMIDAIAVGTAETYVETQTGEEEIEEDIANEEEEIEEVE